MRSQRAIRMLTAAALTGVASLAINGSPPTSSAAAPPPAAALMRAEWTWTGEAALNSFRLDCNWHPLPTCQDAENYPDERTDNATFPTNGGTAWPVDLTTETIGDLTILENVDFDGDGGTRTLKCDTVTFAGGITVKWTADAIITDDD